MSDNFKKNLDTYFYDAQIRKYIIQFMAIFSGLKVKSGKNSNHPSNTDTIYVPVRYGNSSRIVDAILMENTQNKPLRLPIMSVDFSGIEQTPERRKGIGTTDRGSVLPVGNSFPDGVRVIERYQPVPYDGLFELSIYASSEDEHLQILEQILLIFDPTLQIQKSTDPYDFSKLTSVELVDIDFDRNYPKNDDKRIITTNLRFRVAFYLTPPANIKQNFIKSIKLRLEAIKNEEDIWEKVTDITRAEPEYKTLFDIDLMDIPPN